MVVAMSWMDDEMASVRELSKVGGGRVGLIAELASSTGSAAFAVTGFSRNQFSIDPSRPPVAVLCHLIASMPKSHTGKVASWAAMMRQGWSFHRFLNLLLALV